MYTLIYTVALTTNHFKLGDLSRQSTSEKWFNFSSNSTVSLIIQTTLLIMSNTEEKEKPIEMDVDEEESDIEIEGEPCKSIDEVIKPLIDVVIGRWKLSSFVL